MHSTAAHTNWRDGFQSAVENLLNSVEAELGDTKTRARADGATEIAEGLNQTVRRFRNGASEAEVLSALVETSTAFSRRSAAIVLDGARARTTEIRGFVSAEVHFELSQAAAVMTAVETKDPVVAAATETELSPSFFEAAMRDLEQPERAYFFPLVTAGSVRALLFATGNVQPAPLELLCETAGMRWELLDAETRLRPKPSHELVNHELVNIEASKASRAWTELSQQEQALHLKAQRFARVKVAEMRMAKPGAVRGGQEHGDLYRSLKPEIDAAREEFRREFVRSDAGMVDYLYLELVRSLAHDDDRLLGPEFPGLLV